METMSSVADGAAKRATEVLSANGVVLYPTDTLYGLGADALSNEAVDKIYEVKGRDEGKPIHAIVSDLEMAAHFGEIGNEVFLFDKELPKGKATFIVKKKPEFNTGIFRGIETFGFRIPDNAFCTGMVREFGKPVTATSANIAGQPSERSVPKILEQLGEHAYGIALAIDGGELGTSEPSTVIDLTRHHPVILREGAVPANDVWSVLGTNPSL